MYGLGRSRRIRAREGMHQCGATCIISDTLSVSRSSCRFNVASFHERKREREREAFEMLGMLLSPRKTVTDRYPNVGRR